MSQFQYIRRQLIARRNESGVDVVTLASRMGTSVGTVRTFESDNANPTLNQMAAYAKAIGVDDIATVLN